MVRGVAVAAFWLAFGLAAFGQQTIIRMMPGPEGSIPSPSATDPRSIARRAVFEEFHKQNPDVRVANAGGLSLSGDRQESTFLMAMAGDTAPDVFYVNFRQYYQYIDQGFCRPLDDLIARDPDVVDRVNPIIMGVLKSYDGHIYALPWFQVAQALYFRKDIFEKAGLDSEKPPRNWQEFEAYGRQIVERLPGVYGFVWAQGGGGKAYWWSNFVWQAGGEVARPDRTGIWRSAIDSDAAAKALDFFRKITDQTWKGPSGKVYGPIAKLSTDYGRDIVDGKVAMWFSYTNDIVLNMSDLNPSLLGIAAMPEGPGGKSNEINAGMWAINGTITDPKKIDACWRLIKFYVGDSAAKVNTDRFVELGMGKLVNPVLLKRFGYGDIADQVDPTYVSASESLFKHGHPEPYGRNMQQVYVVLESALDRALLEPKTPSRTILHDVAQEMDSKLLNYVTPEVLAKQRAWALGLVIVATGVFGGILIAFWRSSRKRLQVEERLMAGENRARVYRFILLCLIPAGGSILVWSYYPLLKGLVIAFQDYRIIKGTKWVGLDNFISVFTQPIFYKALWNSFLYVGLTILIGFLVPIFLALILHEIPKFKVLFRTIFYLPAMTSPVVIALLWRQFYDRTEQGTLNQLLWPFLQLWNAVSHFFGGAPLPLAYDWLGNPSLAMFAVVLPGVWAGAGPGSILYLAALKNVPEERYEAADLDGASWLSKIRHITLPGLRPLVLINLLGVFIGGFKAMENVFVMTGGGPMYATHTIGLEVWTNAFMFLKFGYATAAAWVMGAILIGFTLIQIRTLTKMKFTTAQAP